MARPMATRCRCPPDSSRGLRSRSGVSLQDLRRVPHAAVDLRLVGLREFQAEGHVLVDRHVRVERVGLEHHRDLALGRRQLVDAPPADPDARPR